MAALKVSALLVLVAQCWTAPLDVLVDGAKDLGTGFCVGDNVVFTCTLHTLSHAWNVSGFIQTIAPASTVRFGGPGNRFTFTLVQTLDSRIISSFSLVIYSDFDGTSITCSDDLLQLNDTKTSTATVLVIDTPPAPTITATTSDDFQSFNVTLTTAGPSANCVLQYSLTITENRQTMSTVNISSSGTGRVGGLNLCRNIYSFTAVAVTKNVDSNSGSSVTGQVDFSVVSELSDVRIDNGVVQWAISSSLPLECYDKYFLRLSRCMIEEFAILPALNLNDDAIRTIFSSISATPPTITMAAVNSTNYDIVYIGDCVGPTLQTSICPPSISGQLVLISTSTVVSTSLCNISLGSEGMASTSSQIISCNGTHAPTGSGGGAGAGGRSGAVVFGVVGGVAVAVILILVAIIIILVVLLSKKASYHEVEGQILQHESSVINPARSQRDSTNAPLYEEFNAAYENTDVVIEHKTTEAAHAGPRVGEYALSQCEAYGVHKKHGEAMVDFSYDEVRIPGAGQ